MKALILAAGIGKRLGPLTSHTPKPLLFVAGKPFLSHIIETLASCGVKDICILVGWQSNKIRDFYGNGSQIEVNISYLEQKDPKGTGDAVLCAEHHINEPFLCINGDIFVSKTDMCSFIEGCSTSQNVTMAATTVENPEAYGSISIEKNILKGIQEKSSNPPSNHINAGLFYFTPDIFNYIRSTKPSSRGEVEITDALNSLAKENDVYVHHICENWLDMGTPQDLLDFNAVALSSIKRHIAGTVEPGATLKGNVVVEEGALVRSGSYIEGPVYISAGCDIGPNCYIRPATALARNVRVGAAVEIKNSIIMAGTHIPHHNYVGDSIIGEKCNLGAGTKIANLRFDGKNIKTYWGGDTIDSKRRKLGAVLGDSVSTGINSMIDAGSVIYENTVIGPGAFVAGNIAPGSRIS